MMVFFVGHSYYS